MRGTATRGPYCSIEIVDTRVMESAGCSMWTRLSASMSKVMAAATFAPLGQGTGRRIIAELPSRSLTAIEISIQMPGWHPARCSQGERYETERNCRGSRRPHLFWNRRGACGGSNSNAGADLAGVRPGACGKRPRLLSKEQSRGGLQIRGRPGQCDGRLRARGYRSRYAHGGRAPGKATRRRYAG